MSDHNYPLRGKVTLARAVQLDTDSSDAIREIVLAETPPTIGVQVDQANIAISTSAIDSTWHYPLIDFDIPVHLVPSSTEGHSHLYIDRALTWQQYRNLLSALEVAGLVGTGTVEAAMIRGYTALRLPWIRKSEGAAEPEAAVTA